MSESIDSIVVGAGHNGLVCAAYLAKAGHKVLVVEAAEQVGGGAVTREIAPGFKVPACAHILHLLHPKVQRDLNLKAHGLRLACKNLPTVALDSGGGCVTLSGDKIGGAVSPADQKAWRPWRRASRALSVSPMTQPYWIFPMVVPWSPRRTAWWRTSIS